MRRFALLLALAMAGAVTGTSGGATSADSVTMSVRQYLNPNKVRTLAFTGRISSGATGELVTVVGTDCLGNGPLQLAAAQTVGGAWQVESPSTQQVYVEITSGTTMGARWKEARSAPYHHRFGLIPYPLELKRGVVTVRVNPSPLNLKLARKTVALQRFRANARQPYLQTRLKYKPRLDAGAYNHEAVFKVARGLKLRALVPTATARPCYLAGASKPFTSHS
jgi:hypothetical protein